MISIECVSSSSFSTAKTQSLGLPPEVSSLGVVFFFGTSTPTEAEIQGFYWIRRLTTDIYFIYIYMVRPPTMIYLELFYMVKHSKNTHFSKTKFVFDFHFCFERKCIFPWVFEGFSKKP